MHVAKDEIRFKMLHAYKVAEQSTDKVTRNGALICEGGWNVVSGCNHHIYGFELEDKYHERPIKYHVTEHAERDVLLKALHEGIKVNGLTMVANWIACPDCARAIVLSGIKEVIYHQECMDRTPERWKDLIALGLEILRRGGVSVVPWSGKVGDVINLNGGKLWYP